MAEEIRKKAPKSVVESNATEIKTEKPKMERKPREKVRSVEELAAIPATKMTDKEKNKLIKALREANTLLANQVEAFKQNAESSFAQTRDREDKYEAMERYYRQRLQYIDTQLTAFVTAVNEATKGGTM